MYGDEALQLILSLRRAHQTQTLPKHQSASTRSVALETRQIGSLIAHLTEQLAEQEQTQGERDKGTVCHLTVLHLAARRNKRCLLGYCMGRTEKLKEMYWAAGGGLAHLLNSRAGASVADEDVERNEAGGAAAGGAGGAGAAAVDTDSMDLRSRLSPQEMDFLQSYSQLVLDYKSPYLDVLDLSLPLVPPGDLYVDVKVVKECGVVWMEESGGQVEFRLGGRYNVRRADVERLLVQGYLEEV